MKAFIKKSFFIIVSLVVLSFIVACGNSSDNASKDNNDVNEANDTNEDNGGVAEPGGDAIDLNIGYTGPFSGPGAYFGEATFSGLELAANEINEAGGFVVDGQTYKVNLVSLDDQYLPDQAASNAKRLVQENKVPAIFIPHSGGILAAQIFNEIDEFLIMGYSSEPVITEGGNSLTVAIPPKYVGNIPTLANYSMDRFGKRLAVLPTASQYGKDWTAAIVPYWEGLGGEVVFDSSVDFSSDTDFFTLISNALASNPDVMFVGGPSQPVAELVRQTRELGFEGGFMVMDQSKLDEMMEVIGDYETLEGAIGVMPLRHNGYDATPGFIAKYKDKYGKTPGTEQALNYVGLYGLIEAMKAANTVEDVHAIRAHMNEGVLNIPKELMMYNIPGVHDDGVFKVTPRFAAVEDGEVVSIPAYED